MPPFIGRLRCGGAFALAKILGAMGLTSAGFEDARSALEEMLSRGARAAIVDEISRAKSFDRAARRLRDAMRGHRFDGGETSLPPLRFVTRLDQLTRAEGFHVLNDWDGKADRFGDDIIPVEVASFLERILLPDDPGRGRAALQVTLDYYFLHLIGLLAMRAWDDGDPNANLDAVTALMVQLQGHGGSGHVFARRAEILILIATSHFEPDISAYDRLLAKTRELNREHRLSLALSHAAILGAHLRFGLEVTCAGNVNALRDDNVPDYPWLCESMATLLESYSEAGANEALKQRISEALLMSLVPDPQAFLGSRAPASLSACSSRLETIRGLFAAHREALLQNFEAHRPTGAVYSPFAFTFNFPHNLVKGSVVDAALRGEPWGVALDDLLTARATNRASGEGDAEQPGGADLHAERSERLALATTLMRYALASPDTIRGRPHPAIVYDPEVGSRVFERTLASFA